MALQPKAIREVAGAMVAAPYTSSPALGTTGQEICSTLLLETMMADFLKG
jgi:hypothetical protein